MPKDNNQQSTTDTPPILEVETNLPPMIHDQTPPTAGSAAPNDDLIMPAIVTTTTQKKKFAGGKIIATILGLFLLVGGIGAGVYLVGQNQDIAEKAKSKDYADKCKGVVCNSNEECRGDGNCVWVGNPDIDPDGDGPKPVIPGDPKRDDRINKYNSIKDYNERCLYLTGPECGGGAWCTAELASDCALWNPEEKSSIDTPTAPPSITAQCQNIKAYSPTWALLTNAQLSVLTTGSQVNFCVAGSASDGTFDRARLTINGVLQAETTTIRPSSTDFCQLYTIPAGTSTFNVTAQIHHLTLGWK
jgi:hypothetical protein